MFLKKTTKEKTGHRPQKANNGDRDSYDTIKNILNQIIYFFYSIKQSMIIQFQNKKIMTQKTEKNQLIQESQQQFLQPISKFYPPNELITKNYALDEKPILKLMRLQKPQTGSCQDLRKKYKTIFDTQDTLGYYYSYSLSNQIVYLKFNNQNYFRYKGKNATYKFLSGMFIPADKIVNNQVKASKNIYKVLPDFQHSEYKANIQESFGKNCKTSNPKTLRFSSNYQSGNLFIAMKKKQFQYDLILQNDINSKGNTQWFNFVVEFNQEGTYKFNILNFTKSYSQFQDGMRIAYYSYKDQESGIGGWTRGCTNIKYQQSQVRREDSDSKCYSCLRFQYNCSYSNDKVIFAYFYPYTSLDLQKFLKKTLYRKINVHMKMEKIKICETLSGLPVYAISIQHKKNYKPEIIGSLTQSTNSTSPLKIKMNKSVVFLSRQHPGETQSSFITEGIIDILMENGEVDYLKKNIDFYVFPMVNMDGVLYGNYRTNLSGTDLNRIWRNPKKQLHPQIYYIKKYLHMINKSSPISLVVDLHGHSKSLNSFFYGNPPKKDVITGSIEDPRLFPFVCSKKIKQISFLQSTFSITEDKKNSARVVLSEMFPKAHIYTLESSFHGWRRDHNSIHQYTPDVLRKIGRQLVIAYLQFDKLCQKNPQIKEKWTNQMLELKQKIDSKTKCKQQDNGSDSEAEFQLIDIELNAQKTTQQTNQKSIFSSRKELINVLKNENKQNFIQRNLIIRSRKRQNVSQNKYNRKIISIEESPGLMKKEQKQFRNCRSNQGFLSIIKLKTHTEPENSQMCKLTNKDSFDLDDKQNGNYKFSKENIIEKLKRKKIKIQEAINSSTGMKTFLRTMGIPLEKKIF